MEPHMRSNKYRTDKYRKDKYRKDKYRSNKYRKDKYERMQICQDKYHHIRNAYFRSTIAGDR